MVPELRQEPHIDTVAVRSNVKSFRNDWRIDLSVASPAFNLAYLSSKSLLSGDIEPLSTAQTSFLTRQCLDPVCNNNVAWLRQSFLIAHKRN